MLSTVVLSSTLTATVGPILRFVAKAPASHLNRPTGFYFKSLPIAFPDKLKFVGLSQIQNPKFHLARDMLHATRLLNLEDS